MQQQVVLLFDLRSIFAGTSSVDPKWKVKCLMHSTVSILVENSALPVHAGCARWGFYLFDSRRCKPCVGRQDLQELTNGSLKQLECSLVSAGARLVCPSPRRSVSASRSTHLLARALQEVMTDFQWERLGLDSPVKGVAHCSSDHRRPGGNKLYVFSSLPTDHVQLERCLGAAPSGAPDTNDRVAKWFIQPAVQRILCHVHCVKMCMVDCGSLRPRLPPTQRIRDLFSAAVESLGVKLNTLRSTWASRSRRALAAVTDHPSTNTVASIGGPRANDCGSTSPLQHRSTAAAGQRQLHSEKPSSPESGPKTSTPPTLENTCTQSSEKEDVLVLAETVRAWRSSTDSPGPRLQFSDDILTAGHSYLLSLAACGRICTCSADSSNTADVIKWLPNGKLPHTGSPQSESHGPGGDKAGLCDSTSDEPALRSVRIPLSALTAPMLQPWFVHTTPDPLSAFLSQRRFELRESTLSSVLRSQHHLRDGLVSTARRTGRCSERPGPSLRRGQQMMANAALLRARRGADVPALQSPISRLLHHLSTSSAALPAAQQSTVLNGAQNTAVEQQLITQCGSSDTNGRNEETDQLVSRLLALKKECIEDGGPIVSCAQTILNTLLMHIQSGNHSAAEKELKDILSTSFLPNRADMTRKYCADGQLRVRECMFQVVLLIELNWVVGGRADQVDLDKIISLLRMTSLRGGPAVMANFMNDILMFNYQHTQPDMLMNIYMEIGQSPPSVLGCSSVHTLSVPATDGPSLLTPASSSVLSDSGSTVLGVRSTQQLSRQPSLLEAVQKRQILVPVADVESRRFSSHSNSGSSSSLLAPAAAVVKTPVKGCAVAGRVKRSLFELDSDHHRDDQILRSSADHRDDQTLRSSADHREDQTLRSSSDHRDDQTLRSSTPIECALPRTPVRSIGSCFVPETPLRKRDQSQLHVGDTSIVLESPSHKEQGWSLTPRRASQRLTLSRRASFYNTDSSSRSICRVKQRLMTEHLCRSMPAASRPLSSGNLSVGLDSSPPSFNSPPSLSSQLAAVAPASDVNDGPPTLSACSMDLSCVTPSKHVQFLLTPQKPTSRTMTALTPRSILKTPRSTERKRLFSPELFESPHQSSPPLAKRKRLFSGTSQRVISPEKHENPCSDLFTSNGRLSKVLSPTVTCPVSPHLELSQSLRLVSSSVLSDELSSSANLNISSEPSGGVTPDMSTSSTVDASKPTHLCSTASSVVDPSLPVPRIVLTRLPGSCPQQDSEHIVMYSSRLVDAAVGSSSPGITRHTYQLPDASHHAGALYPRVSISVPEWSGSEMMPNCSSIGELTDTQEPTVSGSAETIVANALSSDELNGCARRQGITAVVMDRLSPRKRSGSFESVRRSKRRFLDLSSPRKRVVSGVSQQFVEMDQPKTSDVGGSLTRSLSDWRATGNDCVDDEPRVARPVGAVASPRCRVAFSPANSPDFQAAGESNIDDLLGILGCSPVGSNPRSVGQLTPTRRQLTPTSRSEPAAGRRSCSVFTPPTAFSLLDLTCSPIISQVRPGTRSTPRSRQSRLVRCRRTLAE